MGMLSSRTKLASPPTSETMPSASSPSKRPCRNPPPLTGLARFLWNTVAAWSDHEGPRLSAALAFYATLSLAPLMVSIVALVFGKTGAQRQLVADAQALFGSEVANAVKNILWNAQKPAAGVLSSVISLAVVVVGTSGVFSEVRSALNKLWDIPPQSNTGIVGLIKDRVFAFGLLLAIGCFLLISLIASAALSAIGAYWADVLPLPGFLLSTINFAISFIAVAVLFALIFRYVPDRAMPWHRIWWGAVLTAFLFTVSKHFIGMYLGKAAIGSIYGAAGSLMVLIAWVYYSSMSLYLGAELTCALDLRRR
jgi:membrane protein